MTLSAAWQAGNSESRIDDGAEQKVRARQAEGVRGQAESFEPFRRLQRFRHESAHRDDGGVGVFAVRRKA
ncbi:hypothetical protein [Lentzea sp. CC55]|uniref:hypothetical protein n=1 Tax=Lentzea sp. CC55 TaxID=2884909 RepID=UPI0035B4CCC9